MHTIKIFNGFYADIEKAMNEWMGSPECIYGLNHDTMEIQTVRNTRKPGYLTVLVKCFIAIETRIAK